MVTFELLGCILFFTDSGLKQNLNLLVTDNPFKWCQLQGKGKQVHSSIQCFWYGWTTYITNPFGVRNLWL